MNEDNQKAQKTKIWLIGGAALVGVIAYNAQKPLPTPPIEVKPVAQAPSQEQLREARIARASILEQDIVSYAGFQGEVAGNAVTCWRDEEVKQLTKHVQKALAAFKAAPEQLEKAVSAYNVPLELGKFIRKTQKTNNDHCEKDIMVLEGSIAKHKLAGF